MNIITILLIVLTIMERRRIYDNQKPSIYQNCFTIYHCSVKMFALTHFQPMFHFYNSWKQKSRGFLMFSGVKEVERWLKMG